LRSIYRGCRYRGCDMRDAAQYRIAYWLHVIHRGCDQTVAAVRGW
jgi:hypothetical protein